MEPNWQGVLAQRDFDWAPLAYLLVLLVVGALSKVFSKLKEKYEQEAERREEQRAGGEPPGGGEPSRPGVEPSGEAPAQQVQPVPPPLPPAAAGVGRVPVPRRAPAARRPRLLRRSRGTEALGEEVRTEVAHLRQGITTGAEVSQRHLEGVLKHEAVGFGPGVVEHASRVRVDLHQRRLALRAVIYAEILAPPKALRESPEMWDR